ncbi:MAG TPA: flagellar biosynthetic protein FliO [Terracidiphilus sp.]|nr:flagellar biosynthetic protein FliO [Terracidiphilus sp.]
MGALDATALPQWKAREQVHGDWSLAGWLLERMGRMRLGRNAAARPAPRLALVERIRLAPRQQLALVEAEGRHLLVAISADGAPVFYALDGEGMAVAGTRPAPRTAPKARNRMRPGGRISW